jgi:hypothetical protein
VPDDHGQWRLYWTARGRPVPCRLVPVLAGWAGLNERESAAGIEPGHPILARFLARSRFTWLADGTGQNINPLTGQTVNRFSPYAHIELP